MGATLSSASYCAAGALGAVVSRSLDIAVGGPPIAGSLRPPEADEEEACGRIATQSRRVPHVGSALLLIAAIKALLPQKLRAHPATAAAIAAAVYAGWVLLPPVSDKALLKSEAKLLRNIQTQRNHRWTQIETKHGVWQVHSLHVSWGQPDATPDAERPTLHTDTAVKNGSPGGSVPSPGDAAATAGTGSSTWGVRRSLSGRSPRRRRSSVGSLHGEVHITPRSASLSARSSRSRSSRSEGSGVPRSASARSASEGRTSLAAAAAAATAQFMRGREASSVQPPPAGDGDGGAGVGSESEEDSLPDLPNLDQPPKGHVLVLHGHSAGMGVWGKVVDGLQRSGYAFHLLDMPGWGRSVGPPSLEVTTDQDTIVDMYVTLLEAWREEHGLDKVTILAHSLGAYLSCFWARRFPEHIDNVILVSPAGTFPVMPANSWRAGFAFKSLTPQRFSKLTGRLGLAMFRVANVLFSDDLDPDMVDYYYQLAAASKRLPGAGDRACSRFIKYPQWNRSVWTRPAVGVILGLKQHVTLVFGENDPIVPVEFGALIQQLRPSGLNVFRLTDAAHNPAHCRPTAFCDAIQHALWLYEERLAQRKRREVLGDDDGVHRIIHEPHQAVVPRCVRCGGRVRQNTEALVCDCGQVTFFATPSRRETTARVKEMADTYRRLFINNEFSPQGVNAAYAKVLQTPVPASRRSGRTGGPKKTLQWAGEVKTAPQSPGFAPEHGAGEGGEGADAAGSADGQGSEADSPNHSGGNRARAHSDAILRLPTNHQGKSLDM